MQPTQNTRQSKIAGCFVCEVSFDPRYLDNILVFPALQVGVDSSRFLNDTYEHTAGDECLKRVAQTLKKNLRKPGDYCARCGGEECVIVLPSTSRKGGLAVAEEIRKKILKWPLRTKNHHGLLSV